MKLHKTILFLCSFFFIRLASAACYINGQEVDCGYFYKTWGWFFIVAILILIFWVFFVLRMVLDGYKKMSQYPNQFDYKWLLKWIIIDFISLGLGAFIYYFAVYRKYKKSSEELALQEEQSEDGSIAANHFRKLSFPWSWIANIFFFSFIFGYADGGRLSIQNSKLVFKPHTVNFSGGDWDIELNEINEITLTLGANSKVKQMFVNTDSSKERFIVWESQKDNFIKALKQKKVKIIREDE
jgi:hypothetical protein